MPKMSNDFAFQYPRARRQPLSSWSRVLTGSLRGAVSRNEQKESFHLINRAALIFAYLGELERSMAICEAGLLWVANFASTPALGNSSDALRLAIDPWVNIGRLKGFQGETEEALAHFSAICPATSESEIALGPCRFAGGAREGLRKLDPRVEDATRSIFVADTVKALFCIGNYRGVIGFIDDLQNSRESVFGSQFERRVNGPPDLALRGLANEALLIAKSRLGLHDEVIADVERMRRRVDPYHEAVLLLYRLQSCIADGDFDAVRDVQRLALIVEGGLFDSIEPTAMLRFIEKLAVLLDLAGEEDLSVRMCKKGLELARALNDQLSSWIFLKRLSQVCGCLDGQQKGWCEEYKRLVSECEYYAVRKAEGTVWAAAALAQPHVDLWDAAMKFTRLE